ncbi:86_t:CDS:1, partial [Cetraspora pellucida]
MANKGCGITRSQPTGNCYVLSANNLTSLGFPSDPIYSFTITRNNLSLMDPFVCVDHCADLAFEYAALQGDKCRCGNNNFDNYIQSFSNESFCNTSCNSNLISNSNHKCGGTGAYLIYSTIKSSHYLLNNGMNKNDKFSIINNKNCVEDSYKRFMSCNGEYGDLTIENCTNICKSKNLSCAGLEDGTQCFCGDASACKNPNFTSYLECSSSCSGNSSQICGGPWALSVYPIELPKIADGKESIIPW